MVPPASSTSAGTNSAFSVNTRPFFSIMVQRSFFFFIGTRAGTARARKVFGFLCRVPPRLCTLQGRSAKCAASVPQGLPFAAAQARPAVWFYYTTARFFVTLSTLQKWTFVQTMRAFRHTAAAPKKKGGRRTRHRPPGKGGTQGGQRHAACPAAGEKLTEPAGCTGMRPRPQPARRHTPGSTGCRRSCSFPARAGAAKSAGPSPQYPVQPSRCWAAARSF